VTVPGGRFNPPLKGGTEFDKTVPKTAPNANKNTLKTISNDDEPTTGTPSMLSAVAGTRLCRAKDIN